MESASPLGSNTELLGRALPHCSVIGNRRSGQYMLGSWSSKGAWCWSQGHLKWLLGICSGAQRKCFQKNTVRIGHCIRDTTLQDRAFCCWPVRSCSLTSQFLLAWACARNQRCTYGLCCFLVRLWKLLYVNSVLRTTFISCYIGKIPLAGLPQKQFVWVN